MEKRDSLTVTQKSAYWVMPPAIRSDSYAPIKEIAFIGKKKKAAGRKAVGTGGESCDGSNESRSRNISIPSVQEKKEFLDSLASGKNSKPAVLAVLPAYSDRYIPSCLSSDLPPVLTDLYEPTNLSLSYYELLQLTNKIVITLSSEQAKAVESKTMDQSTSRLWFRMRAGRITASKFKSVCRTDPANPSLSLIMSVCHPDTMRFKTAATSWGCQHEKDALEHYRKKSCRLHENFHISPAGLFISVQHPYFGASPDGKVVCSCCGPGICEVKV